MELEHQVEGEGAVDLYWPKLGASHMQHTYLVRPNEFQRGYGYLDSWSIVRALCHAAQLGYQKRYTVEGLGSRLLHKGTTCAWQCEQNQQKAGQDCDKMVSLATPQPSCSPVADAVADPTQNRSPTCGPR